MRKVIQSIGASVFCLTLLLMLSLPASAGDFLPTGVQSQLTRAHLTPDLFRRLGEIGRDAQKHNIPIGKTLQQIWSDMDKPSIDAAAKALNKHDDMKNLLARHGLNARQFVIGMLLLERSQYAAAGLIDKSGLNTDNLQFYNQHKEHADNVLAQINKASGAGNDSDSHDSTLKDLQELQKMDTEMLTECLKVELPMATVLATFSLISGPSQYPGGQQPASNVKGLAKVPLDLAANVAQNDLKQALTDIGHGIESQAGKGTLDMTPQLTRGMQEYTTWVSAHCSKKALQK